MRRNGWLGVWGSLSQSLLGEGGGDLIDGDVSSEWVRIYGPVELIKRSDSVA